MPLAYRQGVTLLILRRSCWVPGDDIIIAWGTSSVLVPWSKVVQSTRTDQFGSSLSQSTASLAMSCTIYVGTDQSGSQNCQSVA